MKPTTIDPHELLERKEELLRRRLLHTIDELERRGRATANYRLLIPLLASAGGTVLLWSAGHHAVRGWKRSRRRRRLRRLFRW